MARLRELAELAELAERAAVDFAVDFVERARVEPPLAAERPVDFDREVADGRVPVVLLRELLVVRRLEPPLEPDPDPARLAWGTVFLLRTDYP